jgi:hypothetical protein
MPYRFPRDASRQRQVLCFSAHRDLLQPTALVDGVPVCVYVPLQHCRADVCLGV